MTHWSRTILLAVCAAILNSFAPEVISGVRVECGTAAALLVAISQPLGAAVVAGLAAAIPAAAIWRDGAGAALIAGQCLAIWVLCRRLAPFPAAIVFWSAASLLLAAWASPLELATAVLAGLANALIAELWLRTFGDRWDLAPAPGAERVTYKGLTISVLGSSAGFLALILLVAAGRREQLLHDSLEAGKLREAVALRCDRVDAYLDEHLQALKTLAAFIEESRLGNPELLSRVLARTRANHPGFSSLGVSDQTGFVLARAGRALAEKPYSIADMAFFREARTTGKAVVTGVISRADTGETAVTVSSPVWNGGVFAGLAEGSLDRAQLERALTIDRGSAFRVLDANGTEVIRNGDAGERGSYTQSIRAGEWRVQAVRQPTPAGAAATRGLLVIAVSGLAAILAMVPLGAILASVLTSPLERLGRRVTAFHHGAESGGPRPLPMSCPEEVRALEQRFEEMGARLSRQDAPPDGSGKG